MLPKADTIVNELRKGAHLVRSTGGNRNEFRRLSDAAFILDCLYETQGNQSHAAKRAGVHRNTVRRALNDMHMIAVVQNIKREALQRKAVKRAKVVPRQEQAS